MVARIKKRQMRLLNAKQFAHTKCIAYTTANKQTQHSPRHRIVLLHVPLSNITPNYPARKCDRNTLAKRNHSRRGYQRHCDVTIVTSVSA